MAIPMVNEEKKKIRKFGPTDGLPSNVNSQDSVQKPYSLYEDPKVLSIQARQPNGIAPLVKPVVESVANAAGAVKSGADRFSSMAADNPVAKGVSSIVGRIKEDAANQQIAVDNTSRGEMRKNLGKQFPEGRVLYKSPELMAPQINGKTTNMTPEREAQVLSESATGRLSPNDTQPFALSGPQSGLRNFLGVNSRQNMTNNAEPYTANTMLPPPAATMENSTVLREMGGDMSSLTPATRRVFTQDENGNVVSTRQPLREGLGRPQVNYGQASPQQGAGTPTVKAGNLDIQFGDNVSPEARANVLALPSFTGGRELQNRQFLGRNGYKEVNPVENGLEGLTPRRRAEAITARMGIAANERTAAGNTRVGMAGVENQRTLGMAGVENAKANTEINRKNLESQLPGRMAEAELKNFTVEQQRTIADLTKKRASAAPEEQLQIDRQLEAMGALKREKSTVHFGKIYNEMGQIVGEEPYVFDPSQAGNPETRGVSKVGGQQQQYSGTPPPKQSLIKGKVYPTAKGNAIWNGSAFEPV